MLGASTEAIGSLEEVSCASLEVREGFQEEAAPLGLVGWIM